MIVVKLHEQVSRENNRLVALQLFSVFLRAGLVIVKTNKSWFGSYYHAALNLFYSLTWYAEYLAKVIDWISHDFQIRMTRTFNHIEMIYSFKSRKILLLIECDLNSRRPNH